MCEPIVGAWMKFILTGGQVIIGRVVKHADDQITIDNAEPTAGGFHKTFTFPKTSVLSCDPADPEKDAYRD